MQGTRRAIGNYWQQFPEPITNSTCVRQLRRHTFSAGGAIKNSYRGMTVTNSTDRGQLGGLFRLSGIYTVLSNLGLLTLTDSSIIAGT